MPSGMSFHTLSGAVRFPFASRFSCVPPTLVTSGSLDGQMMAGWWKNVPLSRPSADPLSPELASIVT